MADTLGERQASILRAIVREYIRTGEPVGSKVLVDRSRLNISPATVRNEMARLEELGYLVQPHTSAGRVPSDRGYRFVVDEIKEPRPLAEGQRRALTEGLGEGQGASLEELLRRASDVVSRFTHHAAAVLARRSRPSTLRRLELFPMGAHMATLVLIAENGRVEQRMIPVDQSLSDEDIEALGRSLADDLRGAGLDDASATIDSRAEAAPAHQRNLLDQVATAFRALSDADTHVSVGGVANLASEHDFERSELYSLYEAIERQAALLELLAAGDSDPVTVRIGSELPSSEFRSCSIVVAHFGDGGTALGSVGVIGPTRMDYERVISAAGAVAHALEGTLGSGEQA